MSKTFEAIKLFIAWVSSIVVTQLGGSDSILTLLVALIVCDILTGVVHAIVNKGLSSTEMRNGIIRKLLIFVVIFLAYRVDRCIIDFNGAPIQMFGCDLCIRTLFVLYSCVEEGISLLENLANIGVPVPTWLRGILVQVSDYTNKSTPKAVIAWMKKVTGVDMNKVDSDIHESNKNDDKAIVEISEENSEEDVDKN